MTTGCCCDWSKVKFGFLKIILPNWSFWSDSKFISLNNETLLLVPQNMFLSAGLGTVESNLKLTFAAVSKSESFSIWVVGGFCGVDWTAVTWNLKIMRH